MKTARVLFALLCGLLPALALACSEPINWSNPTQRMDGSALTNLSGVNIYRASSAAGLLATPSCTSQCAPNPSAKIGTIAAPATTWTDATCTDGQTYFWALTAFDANNIESNATNAVTATMPPPPKPNPPSAVTLGPATAYTFEKQSDRLAFLAVGTVPAGTQCDTSQPVGQYFVVPRASVTWFGTVQPPLVVAQC